MRIIPSIFLLIFFLILAGCAAGITRNGYNLQDIQNFKDFSSCRIAIKKGVEFSADEVTLLGQVKVYDTQFSVKCDEEYVLDLLTKEACVLGAHLINITEEKQPNIWSTCYRVEVQYLKLKDKRQALTVKSDPQYEWSLVQQRGAKGRARQKAVISGAAVGGAIGGAAVGN